MDLHLKKKVIIVTGGAKGIGEGIVRTLANEGALVVIVDRSREAAERLLEDLSDSAYAPYFICRSLDTPEDCEVVIKETGGQFGAIHGLVNNAGKNDGVGLEHGSPEAFNQSLLSNIGHYYYLAHYALPYLKKSRGSIVNIGSKTAVTGQGNTSGYAAAKGGIMALTREWAVELLKYGIRVNSVIPAEVFTPLYASWLSTFPDPEKAKASIEQNIPLEQRMTTSEEIAHAVAFLLSDRSSHTTAQHLFVDGGYTHLDRAIGANK
jgi:L-fucose dehydrogenase